jgi:hypothetical protein
MNLAEQLLSVIDSRNPPIFFYPSHERNSWLDLSRTNYPNTCNLLARIMLPRLSMVECIDFRPEMIEVTFEEKSGKERKIQLEMEPDYWHKGSDRFVEILKTFESYLVPLRNYGENEALLEELSNLNEYFKGFSELRSEIS